MLDASSYFMHADGNMDASNALVKAAGAFAFLSGLLGYYTTAHHLCQDVLPFDLPMGDTSGVVRRWRNKKNKE